MEKLVVCNPSDDYKVIETIDSTIHQEIDAKIVKAKKAFVAWSKMSLQKRLMILQALLEALKKQKDEIAELIALEMGMPISVCKKIDIDSGLLHLEGYIKKAEEWLSPEITYETDDEIHTLYYEPKGVVAASIPWNYPFSNFIWAVGQHLVVGNVVVVKHSEYSVLVSKLLEQIFDSIPELSGCCQFVYGDGKNIGNYLIHQDVDMIWFTGSTQTGLIVYGAAAQRGIPVTLELGGSAPAIVMQDADLDITIESVYFSRFINSGQSCDAVKRLLVHESIFDEVVEKLVSHIQSKKVGSALERDTDIGPLANQKQLELLEAQVQDAVHKGVQVVIGGKQPEGLRGAYYEPTILRNISCEMDVWKDEVFGPVLPVVAFKTVEEAIELANDTQFGLGGYVYTQDQDLAMNISQKLKTGSISVNGVSYVIPQDPFGGYKPASGFSREHGKFGLRYLCNVKVVAMKK